MAQRQRDVIELLEHDQREVEEMFAELESLRGASTDEAKSRRKDLTEQVTVNSSVTRSPRRCSSIQVPHCSGLVLAGPRAV